MTAEQREKSVAIAKDVLKQMKCMHVDFGAYILVPDTVGLSDAGADMQAMIPLLVNDSKPCSVCALGACLLSHVKLFGHFKFPRMGDSDHIGKSLFFSALSESMGEENLVLIECAFEADKSHAWKTPYDPEPAFSFGEQFDTPEQRLTEIMRNVIKNDGVFVP